MDPRNSGQLINNLISKRLPFGVLALTVAVLLALVLVPQIKSEASPVITIEPITWNVIGLDSQNVNNGINQTSIGARICNTGTTKADHIEITFVWDSVNPFIGLISSEFQSITDLDALSCQDVYYTVYVSRDTQAINTYRRYHISASLDGFNQISTPIPRELFVIGQQNSSDIILGNITGPTDVIVGETVQYKLQHSTIPAFQQLMHLLTFPSEKFRIKSVDATYLSPADITNNKIYADACGWDNIPDSSNYMSCIGPIPDDYPDGIVGGGMEIVFTVEVLSPGISNIATNVYGYSNGNYIYQYDPENSSIIVNASEQITETPTNTLTQTSTISSTITSTATPTITGTPPTETPTPTSTITGTPPTSTPTITGTPPTPTATGTISPGMGISKSVSATTVRPGQSLSFTLKVSNTGLAPANDVTITDTFQSVLNISSVSTTKGTYTVNSSTRTVTVSVGTLAPNESVTITVVTKVNTTVTTTSTYSNFARLTYKYLSTTFSINSNTVSYRVEVSSTLPGTGMSEIQGGDKQPTVSIWGSLVMGIVIGAIGLLLFILGLRRRENDDHNRAWLITIGSVFILCGLFVGMLSSSISNDLGQRLLSGINPNNSDGYSNVTDTWRPTEEGPWILLPSPTELEVLPDFPVPTPDIADELKENNPSLDQSSITHISIPSIEVDTIVKYVPFSGNTWLISGLKQEVAWMGDTSWPGLGGNTALAGHVTLRDGSNGPFRYLQDLVSGDQINLYTEENKYTYVVRQQVIVEDNDLSVINDTDSPQLTLITCIDWDSDVNIYLRRVIIYSDLVEVKPIYQAQESN